LSPRGRPLKQEGQARNMRLHLRLTDEEARKLEKLSEILKISKTDVVIMALDALYADMVK